MTITKITKRQARELFDNGIDVIIGGHDVQGFGATWRASRFEQPTFDDLCSYFDRLYCHGAGRFLKTEFYKPELSQQ